MDSDYNGDAYMQIQTYNESTEDLVKDIGQIKFTIKAGDYHLRSVDLDTGETLHFIIANFVY